MNTDESNERIDSSEKLTDGGETVPKDVNNKGGSNPSEVKGLTEGDKKENNVEAETASTVDANDVKT